MKSASDIIKLIKDNNIEFVDFQLGDLFGKLHHFTLPTNVINEEALNEGFSFDGSSIRQWQGIEQSDMLIKIDLSSVYEDPFREKKTLCFFCDIYNPRTEKRYEKDPRSILFKALEYLKSSGIGDQVFFGPEPEFFIFDSIRYASEKHSSFYEIDSVEGPWTSGDPDSLGHKLAHKGGYFPVSPSDTLVDFRNETSVNMQKMGMIVEMHHHEVASAGQCEIDIRYDEAIKSADNIHKLKYAVKNTAYKNGKTATFMPKPLFGDNGSGMHIHSSIWKNGKNLYAGNDYAKLSEQALYAIGGILKHGKAIQVFTNPTANSYKRLIPGFEAPVKLSYSATNRSATIRIPFTTNDKARRIEFRCPDSSGCPYLSYAAILMASIDGIENKIHPGPPTDKNLYNLSKSENKKLVSTCQSQQEAIGELRKNISWLTKNNVFTKEAIESYLSYRESEEILPLKMRVNPYEFKLYYDC